MNSREAEANRLLAETVRANTISALSHHHLKRLPGKRKPIPPRWWLSAIAILTAVAFVLGRIT